MSCESDIESELSYNGDLDMCLQTPATIPRHKRSIESHDPILISIEGNIGAGNVYHVFFIFVYMTKHYFSAQT